MKKLNLFSLVAASSLVLAMSQANAAINPVTFVDGGNGGLLAAGGVSGSSVVSQRNSILSVASTSGTFLGQSVPAEDFQQSGIDSETGVIQLKFTMNQTAVLPFNPANAGVAEIDGVFKYDAASKQGYMMSLSCADISGPQICGFVNGSNGKVRNVKAMTASEISATFGAGATFASLTAAQLDASNGGVGVILFDEANPLKFDVKVKDIAGAVLTQSYNVTSEVPVPAAAWLFGSALAALAGLRKRK